jgi:hypothetical protein
LPHLARSRCRSRAAVARAVLLLRLTSSLLVLCLHLAHAVTPALCLCLPRAAVPPPCSPRCAARASTSLAPPRRPCRAMPPHRPPPSHRSSASRRRCSRCASTSLATSRLRRASASRATVVCAALRPRLPRAAAPPPRSHRCARATALPPSGRRASTSVASPRPRHASASLAPPRLHLARTASELHHGARDAAAFELHYAAVTPVDAGPLRCFSRASTPPARRRPTRHDPSPNSFGRSPFLDHEANETENW